MTRHRAVTHASHVFWLHLGMAQPTVRQVSALAAACTRRRRGSVDRLASIIARKLAEELE